MFDCGGGTPDGQMLLILDNLKVLLSHLTSIFQALITQSAPTTQQGNIELRSDELIVEALGIVAE